MHLNTLKPSKGSKVARKRLGRGIGTGYGKTCGRGHKGQKSRSGGKVAVGFEGGQMPLQRRLPKVGFRSRKARTAEVRLNEITGVSGDKVTLSALHLANVIPKNTHQVKIILSGTIERALTVQGLKVTKGAKAAIEAAGGLVEE